jgi:SPX domain protein involved in polyphosphate accumulation
MSHTHQMQANRFELKYIISGTKAIGVRDFVRPYLTPDEYADPKKNNSYWIHSLYLDDPELTLCNSTVRGLKNRFKLRIRFYDDIPHHPVFFEIKARVNDVILKERVAVHRKSVGRLVRHPMPERSDLLKCDGKNWDVLQRFCRFRRVIAGRAEGP